MVFPGVPVTPGTPLTRTIFLPCRSLNDRRRVARSLFKIGLSSLYSCLSLDCLLILLLLLSSGNFHPNPCPVFSCLVCAGNMTWWGRSVQCCTCSNWIHLKCSLLSFSRFRTLGSSDFWSCLPFFGDFTPTSSVTSSSDSSSWPTFTAQSSPLLLMQHSHHTLAFKPPYPFSAHVVSSPFALYTSCFLFHSITLLGFFNGMLGVSELGALNYYTSFRLIPLTLFISKNLTLIYLPLSGSLDSLLCDLIAATPGVVFFVLMSQTLVAASSFSSSRAYSSLSFLPPLFLRLAPTLIM